MKKPPKPLLMSNIGVGSARRPGVDPLSFFARHADTADPASATLECGVKESLEIEDLLAFWANRRTARATQ